MGVWVIGRKSILTQGQSVGIIYNFGRMSLDTTELRKQIIAVVEEYDRVHSVKGVAKNMNMTTS